MSIIWKLERYARYDGSLNEGKGGWELFESSKAELTMTVTESNFLVICHGSTVLESHSLPTARTTIRGLVKGDSILVMYKFRGNTRKFRIKFQSTDKPAFKVCEECTDMLIKFFPVKVTTEPTVQSKDATQDPEKKDTNEPEVKTLEGAVSLSTMAEVLTGKLKANLPQAYKDNKLPTADIGLFLRMCLADPAFPEFVDSVDKELKKIMNETKEV